MERLRSLDFIAYIRFASVYREFADITTLKEVVDSLVGDEVQARRPDAQLPLIPAEEAGTAVRRPVRSRK